MSRTDAHRPHWVWFRDHPELIREVHRHETGACDLPERPSRGWGTRCFWEFCNPELGRCSCAMCTGKPWRRLDNRAARQLTRQVLRLGTDDVTCEHLDALLAQRARGG